jgi:CheY-like chemotaxis protein
MIETPYLPTNSQISILLVEDSPDDAFFMKRAFKAAGIENPLQVIEDGQEAIDFFTGTGAYSNRRMFPLPGVVFLDLKLPQRSGFEILRTIRGQDSTCGLVVIVLTSSNQGVDIQEAYRLGATSFIVKPPTTDQLQAFAKAFKLFWLSFNRFYY